MKASSNLTNNRKFRFKKFGLLDNRGIKEFANKVAEVVLEGITDYFADKAVFQGTKQRLDETQVSKLEPEEEIAEDMLDFAFSMGE